MQAKPINQLRMGHIGFNLFFKEVNVSFYQISSVMKDSTMNVLSTLAGQVV